MIDIENVSKSFGSAKNKKLVLDHINLRFEDGLTHVLLGESGSGKSTLLRMIMGLIPVDQGQIKVEDQIVGPQNILSQDIGYVLQDGGLFPHLTAYENVSLVATTLDWSQDVIRARMKEIAALVDLDFKVLSQYPDQLSGGQKQRVGIMRGVFLNQKVLLLDEPLGALDPILRAHLQTELKRIFNRLKKLVVIVTHDIAEAAYFGHTVSLLYKGKVLQHGSFQDLVDHPKHPYVKEFIEAQRTLIGAGELK